MGPTLALLGSALDPDPGSERMARKLAVALHKESGNAPRDPYDVLAPYAASFGTIRLAGKVALESWLTPMPEPDDLASIGSDSLAAFFSADGCRVHAGKVKAAVAHVAPALPAMIGIDHSASGGAIAAVSERVGAAELGVVVLDAHSDIVPGSLRRGLLDFAHQNPDRFRLSAEDFDDAVPVAGYNCGSFLYDLIEQGTILPENLVIVGCADLPDAVHAEIADERVAAYRAHHAGLIGRGVTFVSRETLLEDPVEATRNALRKLAGKQIYLSVDLDVGARVALTGVRFLELSGIPEWTMATVIETVFDFIGDAAAFAGVDVMEFDFYRAGAVTMAGQDRTYDIALGVLARAAAHLGASR